MDLSIGVALGLLFGAAKVLAIGTAGFGIAWWRARKQVQKLEAAAHEVPELDARLERIERSLDYIASRLEQIPDQPNQPALPPQR